MCSFLSKMAPSRHKNERGLRLLREPKMEEGPVKLNSCFPLIFIKQLVDGRLPEFHYYGTVFFTLFLLTLPFMQER